MKRPNFLNSRNLQQTNVATSFPGSFASHPKGSEGRKTLVQAGHVPPKKWEVTKTQREGGVTRSQFCLS